MDENLVSEKVWTEYKLINKSILLFEFSNYLYSDIAQYTNTVSMSTSHTICIKADSSSLLQAEKRGMLTEPWSNASSYIKHS